MRSLILRVLAWLIVVYRRYLSGRGPLSRTRCSFASEESCSAFGLRVAQTASSLRGALSRIGRRLRRCREACLVTDGVRLRWAAVHDQPPAQLVAMMRADGEGDGALARMLQTRRAVAFCKGDRVAFRACAAALPGKARVVVEPSPARRIRRRLIVFAFLALAPASAGFAGARSSANALRRWIVGLRALLFR